MRLIRLLKASASFARADFQPCNLHQVLHHSCKRPVLASQQVRFFALSPAQIILHATKSDCSRCIEPSQIGCCSFRALASIHKLQIRGHKRLHGSSHMALMSTVYSCIQLRSKCNTHCSPQHVKLHSTRPTGVLIQMSAEPLTAADA